MDFPQRLQKIYFWGQKIDIPNRFLGIIVSPYPRHIWSHYFLRHLRKISFFVRVFLLCSKMPKKRNNQLQDLLHQPKPPSLRTAARTSTMKILLKILMIFLLLFRQRQIQMLSGGVFLKIHLLQTLRKIHLLQILRQQVHHLR